MSLLGHSREIRGMGFRLQRFRRPVSAQAYWLVVLAGLLADQTSKWAVAQMLAPQQTLPLLGEVLHLTYVRNPGAAFSLLAGVNAEWKFYLFGGIALSAFLIMTVLAYRMRKRGLIMAIPLGLISAGALGNLVDRLTTRTVMDFIGISWGDFHFPVFNLADAAVSLGVGWLLLLSWLEPGPRS